MTEAELDGAAVGEALRRAAVALRDQCEYLAELDQALGDGDAGLTARKIADALGQAVGDEAGPPGSRLAAAGVAVSTGAPSTLGALFAAALTRAGKALEGKDVLEAADLATLLEAADRGMQERGKAEPGDKTILDALRPAAVAARRAAEGGEGAAGVGVAALAAAEKGLQDAMPLRSRVGRASWVGERTEGKVDPGCAALVIVLRAVLGRPQARFEGSRSGPSRRG